MLSLSKHRSMNGLTGLKSARWPLPFDGLRAKGQPNQSFPRLPHALAESRSDVQAGVDAVAVVRAERLGVEAYRLGAAEREQQLP